LIHRYYLICHGQLRVREQPVNNNHANNNNTMTKLCNKEVLSSAEKTPVTRTSVVIGIYRYWYNTRPVNHTRRRINRAQLALAGGSPSLHMPPRSACARKICRWRRFAVSVCYISREHGVGVCLWPCACLCSVYDDRCSTVRYNVVII